MDSLSPQTVLALGSFASRLKSGLDSVVQTTQQLAEDVREKSRPLTDSIAENAAVVKTKTLELAENVMEKGSEVADSVKKGTVAVVENVQGRVAPKTVKREGFLTKQVNGNKWVDFYFLLQNGFVQVLPTQNADTPEFSISLDCIQRTEPLDIIVTGKPYCFRVTLLLLDKPDTVVNNWAFFGTNHFTSNKVNNQEVDLILQAIDEDGMKGWVRELASTSSGLVMQDQLKKKGEALSEQMKNAGDVVQEQAKKTGEGAMKLASTARESSFMGSLSNLFGLQSSDDKAT